MRKLKEIVKRNYKLIIGLVIGIVLPGTAVYAATIISGNEVGYTDTNNLGVDNVQDAIDELYTMSKTHCPDGYVCTIVPYYAFGLPTTSSSTDYQSVITSSGSNTFVKLEGEQLSVCIYRNSTLECFKNNNYEEESTHLIEVFGEDACTSDSSRVNCSGDDFHCAVNSIGNVRCYDNSAGHNCIVYSDGDVSCN